MDRFGLRLAAALGMAALAGAPVFAQEGLQGLPRESQRASVGQRIGVNDMAVEYHRPSVKKRVVWGTLVPYDNVWRAGANENTVVSFSHPVKVEGQDLPAGRYGLHMIPTAGEWTIIFSKDDSAWGSFFYKPERDALRVKVKPEPAPFKESLDYDFDDPTEDGVVLAMSWEKLRVPVRIAVDTTAQTLAHVQQQLTGLPGFGWRGRSEAAAFAVEKGVALDEATTWIDRSIASQENATNLMVKADLLEKKGMAAESQALYQKAAQIGKEGEINLIAYQHLPKRPERAVALFELNVKNHPKSWNAHDSLGEAYVQTGKKDLGIKSYRTALGLATDPVQKKRIEGVLAGLEAK